MLRGYLSALPLYVFQTGPLLPFPPTHTKTHYITHFVIPREIIRVLAIVDSDRYSDILIEGVGSVPFV